MTNIAKTILHGRLVRDAEWKYTNSGTFVTTFSIAVNSWQGKEKGEHTSFFDCVMFGKQAEAINQWLTKGKPVIVFAEPRQERWTDKNDNNRSKVVFNVQDVDLLYSKGDESQASHGNSKPVSEQTDFEDDIPF